MDTESPVIVLLTDFGTRDPYVGVMKGVILGINRGARIVDLTHEIPRFDVYTAALTLFLSYRYFPKGTIFVCVVDPGVGTKRKALLIVTNNYFFIGPDNGCLYPAALDDGIKAVYDISRSPYMLKNASATFHGRDIFAPVAAWLSRGVSPEDLGTRFSGEIVRIAWGRPKLSDGCIDGSIVYVDKFGNIMTNISRDLLKGIDYGDTVKVIIEGGKEITCRFERSFGYVAPGELVCYINSWGYLELGVNKGSAADKLGVDRGRGIRVCKH